MDAVKNNSKPHKTGADIQRAILQYCRKHPHIVARKVEVANERGVGDLICCVYGFYVEVEIKGHGDKMTPIQEAQLSRVLDAGGYGVVARSLEDFTRFVEKAKKVRGEA